MHIRKKIPTEGAFHLRSHSIPLTMCEQIILLRHIVFERYPICLSTLFVGTPGTIGCDGHNCPLFILSPSLPLYLVSIYPSL